jgi:hypothetical protein
LLSPVSCLLSPAVGHRREGADDLELAGGFAGEVEGAVEVAGAELAEGEFEEDAGLAEAGGGFEEDERVALEGGGEIALGGLLAGARRGEGRAETEVAEAFAGAVAEGEELGDAFELGAEQGVVGGGEDDGLGQAGLGFDEAQLRVESGKLRVRGRREAEAPKGGVGGELDEILWVVAAEFRFIDGERARDGLDFAKGCRGEQRRSFVT